MILRRDGITSASLGKPDYALALDQHNAYIRALQSCGVDISLLPPALTFVVYGASTLVILWLFIHKRLRRLEGASLKEAASGPLAWLLRGMLALRYTVTETGLEAIAAPQPGKKIADEENLDPRPVPGILFLPNHPALIDPVIV